MRATVKRARRKTTAKKAVVGSKKVKDYSKDSFFVKKAKEMETLLKEHGLPKKMAHA